MVYAKWPTPDGNLMNLGKVKIMTSVDGKTKDSILVDRDTPKETIIKLAKKSEKIQMAIGGRRLKDEIYVPQKIVNFVTLKINK